MGGGEYRMARIKRANSAIGARGKAGEGISIDGGHQKPWGGEFARFRMGGGGLYISRGDLGQK